jgi:hypothetical protein
MIDYWDSRSFSKGSSTVVQAQFDLTIADEVQLAATKFSFVIAWSVLNSGKDFDWKEKELGTAI